MDGCPRTLVPLPGPTGGGRASEAGPSGSVGALERLPRAQDRASWGPVQLPGSTRPLEGASDAAVTAEEAVPHLPPMRTPKAAVLRLEGGQRG